MRKYAWTARFVVGCTITAVIAAGLGGVAGGAVRRGAGGTAKLMIIIDNSTETSYPEIEGAAKAGIKALNKRKTVKAKVTLEVCSTNRDANKAAECARKAADDPDVVATLNAFTSYGDSIYPVLAEGGLVDLGTYPLGLADYKCPVCYPVTSGGVGSVGGQGTLAANPDVLGAKTMNVVILDVPAGRSLSALMGVVLAPTGATLANTVLVPTAATDLSAQVAASTQGDPGAVLTGLPEDFIANFVRTYRQQGSDVPLISTTSVLDPDTVADLGNDVVKGMYMVSQFGTTGPGPKRFLKETKGAKVPPNDLAKNAWTGVQLFEALAKDLDTVDRAGITAAAPQLSAFDSGGMTPVLDYTKPFAGFNGLLARMFNRTVVYGKFDAKGKFKPLLGGEFQEFLTEG